MNLRRFRRRVLLSLVFGALVFLGLLVYGDLSQTLGALSRFSLIYLPAIVALTLANYLIRFVKWHYYLRVLGVRNLPVKESLLIFFSGLSMTVTPGKIGEWIKIYLLQSSTGLAFSRAAPIVLAERLTDGLALLILASGGVAVFGLGTEVLLGTLIVASIIVIVSQIRPLALAILSFAEKIPVAGKFASHFREFYEGSYLLFRAPTLILAIFLGVISWSGECVAYFLVLVALGIPPEPIHLLQATFILAASTLAGALLLTPGGLGVAEGGITGLTQLLVGVSSEVAAAGTIIIRACTLWFGVGVGAIALFILTRHDRPEPVSAPSVKLEEQHG